MIGLMAKQYCGVRLEISVLQSAAGFYLGTCDEDGPVSRESGYYSTGAEAQAALDSDSFTQRTHP